MTVYDYIGESKPYLAMQVCEEFGYDVRDKANMGQNLKTLVQREGEKAVKRIMEVHPDKEIILEMNSKPEYNNASGEKKSGCGCGGHKSFAGDQFHYASGVPQTMMESNSESKALATNTNTIIFASALFLAVAIIYKN